jgi:hypothetical protein
LYLSWLLGEHPSEFSKFNFNISQVKDSLYAKRRCLGVRKVTVPVWVLDSPSPRTVQRTFLQQDGPYRNKVPSSSEEAGTNSENVKEGKKGFQCQQYKFTVNFFQPVCPWTLSYFPKM